MRLVLYEILQDTRDVFHLCGVFATVSLVMVNLVSNSLLRGESFTDGCLGPVGARIWFFVGFMMGFGSLIGEIELQLNWSSVFNLIKLVAAAWL